MRLDSHVLLVATEMRVPHKPLLEQSYSCLSSFLPYQAQKYAILYLNVMQIVDASLKIGLFSEEHDLQEGEEIVRPIKVIVEKHADGYVAYPLGVQGVIVGEGDTYEEALTDVKSAIRFHIETFGQDVLQNDDPVLEAFVAETEVAV